MAYIFEFSVLRLAPDHVRGEAINLGIVVFKSGELDIHLGQTMSRAKMIFPSISSEIIRESVSALKKFGAIEASIEQVHGGLQQFGIFSLSEVGRFTIEDISQYQAKVSEMLKFFTAQKSSDKIGARRVSRLVSEIRTEFRKERILGVVGDSAALNEHKIVPEWPIPSSPSIKASLALLNGKMRVCEIADMSFSDEGKYPRSLLEGIVTLDVAKRVANAQECVFAYRAIGPTSRIDEALSLVRPHATRIVNCDNVRERKSFTEEWTEAARVA